MGIIYCGKQNSNKYYIKEADISISSIQELAYFIYNFAILISNSFITKNLIVYIDKSLGLTKLSSDLNEMFNRKENLVNMLTHILLNSNYYDREEVGEFRKKLIELLSLPEEEYVKRAGDMLFGLKKYEKAISQYNKIMKTNDKALQNLAFCYAKLQFYEQAADYIGELYKRTRNIEVLREAYYALKLAGNVDKIYEYEKNISEELLADWEYEIVSRIIKTRRSDELKNIEEIFLLGHDYIKENISNRIKIWKEKYRYIG